MIFHHGSDIQAKVWIIIDIVSNLFRLRFLWLLWERTCQIFSRKTFSSFFFSFYLKNKFQLQISPPASVIFFNRKCLTWLHLFMNRRSTFLFFRPELLKAGVTHTNLPLDPKLGQHARLEQNSFSLSTAQNGWEGDAVSMSGAQSSSDQLSGTLLSQVTWLTSQWVDTLVFEKIFSFSHKIFPVMYSHHSQRFIT